MYISGFPRCAIRRAGTVYIAVLGVAMIVGVIGICSLHVARLEVREVTTLDDMARARLAARSGMECALATIQSNSLWRTVYTSGTNNSVVFLSNALTGDDSFQFAFIDSDGDLADEDSDAVTMRAIGTAGDARHVLEVMLMPTGLGVSSLSASMHIDGKLDIYKAVTTSQTVSSNSDIKITSPGLVNGNAQAAGTIDGTASGTKSPNMNPELEMPDPTDAFEYYISNGTPISFSQLPGGKIEKVVLSAGYNPYGSQVTNAQGIYVINGQGNKVSVRDSRIRATLVFINASGVEIENSIVWEPHLANLPAMMVQGSLNLKWASNNLLSESSLDVNFNPSHTAYSTGSDSDKLDQYSGLITGLIYATGSLDTSNMSNLDGVLVIGGTAKIDGSVGLEYDSNYYNDAPPGFTSGTDMEIVPGTWKQVAY
jgi:hypothetical protein